MDLNEFREIIENEGGGKVIIVENGKPVMVVMSYEEYRKKKRVEPRPQAQESYIPSRNSESPPQMQTRVNPYSPAPEEKNPPAGGGDGLTIDDLPL